MIYAGILAAGVGARMHRMDMPKQFLPLGEKPIIIHTLEQFFMHPQIGRVIIVAPEAWMSYAEDLARRNNKTGMDVSVIAGGMNKTESIFEIVRYVEAGWGIGETDMLIAHDAIRPFVTQRIIDDNITAALEHGAANTVVTTNDTIVVSDDGATISEVPDKKIMYAEQTPQTYMLKKLRDVFQKTTEKNISLKEETELTRLYIQNGNVISLVAGEYSNMKIINPYDLEIANALLKEKKR